MSYTQDNRAAAITTPLGKDKLLLKGMIGEEAISEPFNYTVEMLSEDGDLKFEKLIGEKVTIRLNHVKSGKRYFNGIIADLCQSEPFAGLHCYQAQVVPWFWLLKKSSNCRIFRNETIPDILTEKVFKPLGFSGCYELRVSGSYPKLEHCVQYKETDFAFACRLMEEVGIYYYFTHKDGEHTMVLADSKSAHDPCPDFGTLKYIGQIDQALAPDEIIRWQQRKQVVSGAFELTDFNFAKPKEKLAPEKKDEKKHSQANFAHHTYEGEYIEDGGNAPASATKFTDLAKIRLAALQAEHAVYYADSDCRGLQVGHTFKLTDCFRSDQNGGYLITSMSHQIELDDYVSGGNPGANKEYTCTIRAIPDTVVYRPMRVTPKSRVAGPQTATVVGKDGEEIHTDEFGRVKVQFHWDRDKDRDKIKDTEGQKPENRSCWVRVSQNWAGKKWGAFFLPRIGQEVIVDFLEGDPDRPIITGRVYNGDAMPPYELPTHKTISTIKSNSSKGGQGFNELRFEDKKDGEQIFLHAEKDIDTRVLNDHREAILGNMDLRIGEGKKHESKTDGGNRKGVGNRTTWIETNEQLMVLKDRFESIKENHHETTGKDNFQKTVGSQHLTIEKDENIKVNGTISCEAGKDIQKKSGSNYALDAGSEIHLKAGSKIIIEGGSQISLKVGGNFIDIGPSGVSIKGTMVKINSGGSAGSGGGSSPTTPTAPKAPEPDAFKAKEAEKAIDDQPIKFSK